MNAGLVGEGLLAQPLGLAELAQVPTEALAYIHAALEQDEIALNRIGIPKVIGF